MPKLKTKSSAKKRFRLTGSGDVKMWKIGRRHNMRKRSNKMLRDSRGNHIIHPSEQKRIKTYYLHV